LIHARRLLGPLVDSQVALVHADATALPFDTAGETVRGFDGVWTVQVFQHIPDFDGACREARRVLRLGGHFVNFSLHDAPLYRPIYRIAGKTLHLDGMVNDAFHLTRANCRQRATVASIFGGKVTDRYTECFFHPNFGLSRAGRCGSWMGRLDAWLGNFPAVARWIARQRSFSTVKAH
ncbi:MAG: class I SAM-dependent methyltransferase, partial [Acidobacteriota bacterium]|nr:class I SAM-dependent methyltransferase [Acidobacteriota bacterium]